MMYPPRKPLSFIDILTLLLWVMVGFGRPTHAFVPTAHTTATRTRNHHHHEFTRLHVSIPLDDYKTSDRHDDDNNFQAAVPSSVSPGSAEFPKVGILLLNLGGPETLEDVEGTWARTGREYRTTAEFYYVCPHSVIIIMFAHSPFP